jgi:electron transfer flavoprotein beta subunit
MVEIVVLLKQVPDTNAKIIVSGDRVDESAVNKWSMSPYDEYALEQALQHKESAGGKVTAITLGPARAEKMLKDAAAVGADDLVRLWEDDWGDLDSNQVQQTLAAAVSRVGAEVIYCGKESADNNQGSTGPGVAERIGAACVVQVSEIGFEGDSILALRPAAGGNERVLVSAPAVLTCDKTTNEPRRPNVKGIMMAKKKQIELLTAADLGIDLGGGNVSTVNHTPPAEKQPGKQYQGAESVPIVVGLLRNEAKVL